MATLNKVILIGHLGRDPELRYMASGDAVTHMTLATSERWHDKASGEKEHTEWHRVVLYRKLAEIADQYLRKGAQVYIEGRLQTRKWADKAGVERSTIEIIADDMRMLGAAHAEQTVQASNVDQQAERRPSAKRGSAQQAMIDEEEHIPF